MKNRMSFYQTTAGMGTAVVVVLISGSFLWGTPLFWESMAWQVPIIGLFFALTSTSFQEQHPLISKAALWGLLPLISIVTWRAPLNIYFIYTIIWVACSPYYLTRQRCWYWLIAINLAWYLVRVFAWQDEQALTETLMQGTFYVFALFSAMTAQEAEKANQKTQQLNRELLATQHLLNETSRESERTRIARDLHDLLGHHLTALTINLQVAGRISDGEVKENIDQCHALSKLLLNDVREAVSALREMPVVNLRELLEVAVRDIPRLKVSLEMENELRLDDVNTAEVLLRSVQEAITNTLKHSDAREAAIQVCTQHDQIILSYSDSGGGCDKLEPGNGLQGMRERVERIGGKLEVESLPTLSLRVSAPMAA